MRRLLVTALASLLLVGVFAPAIGPSDVSAAQSVPKVVIVVGPAGAATSRYKAEARKAAALARRFTPDVTEVYSPNATWPAVRAALQGASVVIYMGHGNGWPSRYRDSLYPPTQDGFGLNPGLGGGDSTHQYFGEGFVGSEIKLAKNAIVLLNHLCYASGNTEPGLAEGTLDQARQRVDNYAAGFIKAGASAVIAEAWSSPNYFVRAILAGTSSIQNAWLHSPSANGHRLAFSSQRSRGYVAQMDPETATSGFTRSIVMKSGLAPRDVLAARRAGDLDVVDSHHASLWATAKTRRNGSGVPYARRGYASARVAPYSCSNRSRRSSGRDCSTGRAPVPLIHSSTALSPARMCRYVVSHASTVQPDPLSTST